MFDISKPASEKHLAITGAGGFIGANLCRHYLSQGWQVSAVQRAGSNGWRLPEHPNLRVCEVDFKEEKQVRSWIEENAPSVLMNLAAYGAYPSQTEAELIYQVNMTAVRWMLESLRGASSFKAFIQTGSSSEYGVHCSAPTEETPTRPDSHYSVSKIGATSLCQYYAEKYQVPTWILRLYSVYGPYEDPSRLIIKLLRCVSQRRLPPLVDPRISRDFVYIQDVCEIVDCILQRADSLPKGEIFNVGSGVKTTLEDLIHLIRESFHVNVEPQWNSMKSRSWDHADWYANPSKAKKILGWHAKTSLREGLHLTMQWIQENNAALIQSDQNSVIRLAAESHSPQVP